MPAPKKAPGTIIQFGSGHPGEEGSAAFEAKLFEELGLKDPNVLFFPFHSMPPDSGDLALFKQIYGRFTKGWIRGVQLHPPRWPDNTAQIYDWLEGADVVVLGSGFPQPFIRLMRRLGLPARLRQMHRRGVHFLGYSAGSLALSEGYFLPFTGEDLLIQLDLLDHISLGDERRMQLEAEMRSCLKRDDAEEFLDRIRARVEAKQDLDAEQKSFLDDALWMEQAWGFGMTPGITACPHYGERFQYRAIHLRHLGKLFPDFTHVGIPNACALVSRFETGEDGPTRAVTFRGHNHRRAAGWIKGPGDITPIAAGEPVPFDP